MIGLVEQLVQVGICYWNCCKSKGRRSKRVHPGVKCKTSVSVSDNPSTHLIKSLCYDISYLDISYQFIILLGFLSQNSDSKVIGTLFLELKAIPTYILGHEIRHRNNIFSPDHTSQLRALLSSTHASVSSLLELPLDTIVHLPACSLTTLWYCLLILSKLTLLAPTDVWNEKIGLEKKSVYQLGLDTMEKFGALSTGDDVWANSRRVIGSMLSWLEKHEMSNLQPSNIEPHKVTSNSHGLSHPTCTSNNIYTSDNIYSADASVPASWYGKSAGFHNDTNANAVPSSGLSSLQSNQAEYIENPTQEFWNDAIWQQMLEDFAVMPTALPAQFSSPSLGPFV